jgi:hypothetical protein
MTKIEELETLFEVYRNGSETHAIEIIKLIQSVSGDLNLDLYVFKKHVLDDKTDYQLMNLKNSTPQEICENYKERNNLISVPVFKSLNLYLNITGSNLIKHIDDSAAEISFYIYDNLKKQQISHSKILLMSHHGKWTTLHGTKDLSTTFINISNVQIQPSLYLVCQIVRIGKSGDLAVLKQSLASETKSDGNFTFNVRKLIRYSCVQLSKLALEPNEKSVHDYTWNFPAQSDTDIGYPKMDWLELLKRDLVEKGASGPVANQLFSLQISLYGTNDIHRHISDSTNFRSRSGLLNSILPFRDTNSIYITINEGVFSQRKVVGKNIQVTAQARRQDGSFISCISQGEPMEKQRFYDTIVYNHNNQPSAHVWNETFRIDLPAEDMLNIHLFLTFRLCSSSEAIDVDRNLRNFAFAFL